MDAYLARQEERFSERERRDRRLFRGMGPMGGGTG